MCANDKHSGMEGAVEWEAYFSSVDFPSHADKFNTNICMAIEEAD
jgi:hypothetical protein